jgi:hypothetical protein
MKPRSRKNLYVKQKQNQAEEKPTRRFHSKISMDLAERFPRNKKIRNKIIYVKQKRRPSMR